MEEGPEKFLGRTWHASAVSRRQPDLDVIRAANDPAARPVRVIGLVASCPITPPAEMVLVGLEDWTTFFVLRWFFATTSLADDIDRRLQAGLEWTAVDDLGTHYRGGDYGGGAEVPAAGSRHRGSLSDRYRSPACNTRSSTVSD